MTETSLADEAAELRRNNTMMRLAYGQIKTVDRETIDERQYRWALTACSLICRI